MARYKHIDTNPRFLPVDLARQLPPGAFERALNYLIDHEPDLLPFDARYRNDATGVSIGRVAEGGSRGEGGSVTHGLLPRAGTSTPPIRCTTSRL